MVISSVTGITAPATTNEVPVNTIDTAVARQVESKKSVREIEGMLGTEQYVRQYFSDIPIMIAIARCESHFRQLDPDGEIHRGQKNNADVGVMQINEFYHGKTADRKDYNIYTIEGNTAYARDLYERQGTEPWSSSKACWGKYQEANKSLALNSK